MQNAKRVAGTAVGVAALLGGTGVNPERAAKTGQLHRSCLTRESGTLSLWSGRMRYISLFLYYNISIQQEILKST